MKTRVQEEQTGGRYDFKSRTSYEDIYIREKDINSSR
jgi:hypothetical protein